MSYLEYTVKTVPAGWRKMLFLNWPLIILLTAIAGVGFLMLYSVAGGSINPWAEPQMKRYALGLAVMFIVAMVPIWFWRNMSVMAYLVALALLIAVEFFGTVGMGAQRWINLGFMRLQPSELMKIAMVMILAAYYDWLPMKKTSHPFWVLVPVFLILLPTFLVLTQPDLGTAILLVAGGGLMMFLAGVHWAYFATVIAAGVGGIYAVFLSRGTEWQL
ncbi:MAG: FtsW/RodA/SpoVE family cell cycle protein, partial [Marivita sp.]